MKLSALVLLAFSLAVYGCATATKPEPPKVEMVFVCADTSLIAYLLFDGHPLSSVVGRCIGNLRIIGVEPTTGT